MPIPGYETLMMPLLEKLSDGKPHHMRDLVSALAKDFQLSQQELEQQTQSGAPVFYNRVYWARAHLKAAHLISSPGRGMIQITEKGLKTLEKLSKNPEIRLKSLLQQDPNYKKFLGVKDEATSEAKAEKNNFTSKMLPEQIEKSLTPHEQIEKSLEEIRHVVVKDLEEKIKKIPPKAFERLILNLLLKMGYGGSHISAGELTGGPGDEGIDAVIRQDPLGLDNIYLQAKRWDKPVDRQEIQKFVGALVGKKAKKGVFITSSTFTKKARKYVLEVEQKVVLIDGMELAQLMYEYDIGVYITQILNIKRIDYDYFAELAGEEDA